MGSGSCLISMSDIPILLWQYNNSPATLKWISSMDNGWMEDSSFKAAVCDLFLVSLAPKKLITCQHLINEATREIIRHLCPLVALYEAFLKSSGGHPLFSQSRLSSGTVLLLDLLQKFLCFLSQNKL